MTHYTFAGFMWSLLWRDLLNLDKPLILARGKAESGGGWELWQDEGVAD